MKKKSIIYAFIIVVAVTLTYSNHFHNPFHFDDAHTIESNIYIKSLSNIPLFFKDASTFSSSPMNQLYRPVVTLTLAIDYYMGGGLNPFYFHLSMFFWFLVQLVLMFILFKKVFNLTGKHKWNSLFVFLAVAWYGLHTANAETINYIISRSGSLSTLCVVAGMLIYISFPNKRKYFLYLIPVIIGMLAKEHTAMFASILFFYILLFENKMSLFEIFSAKKFPLFLKTLRQSVPALIVCSIGAIIVVKMQTESFTPGGTSPLHYFITQPWVYLRYFIAFFLPVNLSADHDWQVFQNIFDERVIVGFTFIILIVYAAFKTSQKPKYRPVSWGILWFLFSLLPTSSFIPLGQVTNDHRMFFPFVGLVMAVVWAIRLYLTAHEKKITNLPLLKYFVIALFLLILIGNAHGVRKRNVVWSSAENLWHDVTIKSPNNGRGLMNYGLALMRRGDLQGAYEYYQKALLLVPHYSYLHINLGVVNNAMGRKAEAEEHFKKGVTYGPRVNVSHYYYANFLFQQGRSQEALHYAETALNLAPAHLSTRHLLMRVYHRLNYTEKLNSLINETLKISPNDSYTLQFMSHADENALSALEMAEKRAQDNPTPENFLNLSLIYYNNNMYDKCIEACYSALELRPDYAKAYFNICCAHIAEERWDEAIENCQKALKIDPNLDGAQRNLNWALQQKELP